jgi:hypothetical protein
MRNLRPKKFCFEGKLTAKCVKKFSHLTEKSGFLRGNISRTKRPRNKNETVLERSGGGLHADTKIISGSFLDAPCQATKNDKITDLTAIVKVLK